jgi:hypothetical protein
MSNFPNGKSLVKKQLETALENAGLRKVEVDLSDSKFQLLSLDYATLQPFSTRPEVLEQSRFDNQLPSTAQQTFSVNKSTTNVVSWTVTAGLELSEEFSVGLPFIGGNKTTVKLNFGVSTTQSTNVTRQWAFSTTIPVEAHSTVLVTFEVDEASVRTPFTATFLAEGDLKVTYKDQKGHDEKFKASITEVLAGKQIGGVTVARETFQVQAKGEFTGTEAQNFHVSASNPTTGAKAVLAHGAPGAPVMTRAA